MVEWKGGRLTPVPPAVGGIRGCCGYVAADVSLAGEEGDEGVSFFDEPSFAVPSDELALGELPSFVSVGLLPVLLSPSGVLLAPLLL